MMLMDILTLKPITLDLTILLDNKISLLFLTFFSLDYFHDQNVLTNKSKKWQAQSLK